jgi:hypothetical protein
MKYLGAALLFAVTATVSVAQSVPSSPDPSGIAVVRFSWSKELVGWEKDPFSGPIENFDEMRARTRNEKRIEDAKRGNSAEVDKIRREARADAANIAAQHKSTPSRYVFVYKLTLRNSSNKVIKSVDWDYIFLDRASLSEIGHQQFTSEDKIASGKAKELTVVIKKPPTHTISLTALNNNERDALSERVVLVRIVYADGSTWERP